MIGADARQQHEVSVLLMRAVLRGAERAGVSIRRTIGDESLLELVFSDPPGHVGHGTEEMIWRRLIEASDPGIGARAALLVGRGAFGELEYACRSADTIAQAVACLARFDRVIHGTQLFELRSGDQELVYHSPHDPDARLSWVAAEFAVVTVARLLRELGAEIRRVELRHEELVRGNHNGLVVEFNGRRHAICLDAPHAAACREADPALHAIMLRLLETKLVEIPAIDDARARIARLIEQDIARGGGGALCDVAKMLGVSQRTLQVKLSQCDTTYRELRDEVRMRLALGYLQSRLSMFEIADRLGFSDVRSFHRAFRRFAGKAPSSFRAS